MFAYHDLQLHWHDDGGKTLIVIGSDEAGTVVGVDIGLYFLTFHNLQGFQEVATVEAEGQRVAVIVDDLFVLGIAEIGAL